MIPRAGARVQSHQSSSTIAVQLRCKNYMNGSTKIQRSEKNFSFRAKIFHETMAYRLQKQMGALPKKRQASGKPKNILTLEKLMQAVD